MIKSLSYVGFCSPDADAWRAFGADMLGLGIVSSPDDAEVRLRMDEAAWRIAIMPGETNDIRFIGWDVGSEPLTATPAITPWRLRQCPGTGESIMSCWKWTT